jgi:16S rRNA (guanine527-N7)-methyltransferase
LPELHVSLIESRRKKANFLRAARRAARLENVQIIEGRAEEVAGGTFDAVTSRALGSVSGFLCLARRLLRVDGLAIAMRGPEGANEAIAAADFAPARTIFYRLALERERVLLIYRRL